MKRTSNAERTTNLASGVRVLCDIVLITLSLLVVLLGHHIYNRVNAPSGEHPALSGIVGTFIPGALILGSISINALYLSGFYQRTRSYQARYKARAILKTVTASQLLFAFVIFMFWDVVDFPRSILIPNWMLTVALLIGARIYAHRLPIVDRFLGAIEPPTSRESNSPEAESRPHRILLVGGAGYVGSGLLRKLLNQGYEVRLLDSLMFGEEPIADLIDHPNLEVICENFQEVHHAVRAVAGMDTVIHLGAIVGDPACALDAELTVRTNLLATRMLAEVAQCAGVSRFVFASTCSVYGASEHLLDERSELNPVSLYAQSKIACEEVLADMASKDFSPVILRFGTIYGLSGRTRFDLVVNLLTAKALFDREITVFGGDQWRPFLHVDDAAAGVFAAVEAPREVVHGRVYNVGSDEQNYTIGQVGELIQSIVPTAELKNMGNDGERRDYRVDFSRIRNELGFKPAWTVPMGIRQVIDAIENGEVTDYTDTRYSNVKSLIESQSELAKSAGTATPADGLATVIQMNYDLPFAQRSGEWTKTLVQQPNDADLAAASSE